MRTAISFWLIMIAAAAAHESAAQEIIWSETRYNPRPAAGDLVLPMPCGGAMAFRRVATPYAEGGMNDVAIEIGGEIDKYAYLRGRRRAFVAGPFKDENGFFGYFIAKYEVAKAQYDVMMGDACPNKKLRKNDFVALTGVTWFEAVNFTERYSHWLAQNAADDMPRLPGAASHVRLPTEAEWEYAARGGSVVDAAAFREPVYPLSAGTLAEHEAYGATNSANGKVQPIGSLAPNPLGLHDMLGNVAELTIEPFRLVRHLRDHGRIGGFVKRGADANANEARIAAATRQEVRFYDPLTAGPLRDRYLGFRPVLSTIAIDSEESADRYAAASAVAASPDLGTPMGAEEAKALKELETTASIQDPDKRRRAMLEVIRTLDAARAGRNRQRDRAIESLFLASASTCATVLQQFRALNVLSRRERDARAALEPARDMKTQGVLSVNGLAELARAEVAYLSILDRIAAVEQRVAGYLSTYSEFIDTLQSDYGPDVTGPQADLLRRKLDAAGPAALGRCLGLSTVHLSEARETGRFDLARWRNQIESIQ